MPETLESLRASFNRSLRVEGKADRTLVVYGQSITYFSQWLLERDLAADLSNLTREDPLAGIGVDKPEPPPVPVFTDDELTALVNACGGKDFNDLRDAEMIRQLIDCGLRVSELTGLDVDHLKS